MKSIPIDTYGAPMLDTAHLAGNTPCVTERQVEMLSALDSRGEEAPSISDLGSDDACVDAFHRLRYWGLVDIDWSDGAYVEIVSVHLTDAGRSTLAAILGRPCVIGSRQGNLFADVNKAERRARGIPQSRA